MSYYNSKHPGLFAFIVLLNVTVISILTLPVTPVLIGTLSIFWSILTLTRTLSLYEVDEHYDHITHNSEISKIDNNQGAALAYDLTHRMQGHDYFNHGKAALACVEDRTLMWFALAGLYILSNFLLAETAIIPAPTLEQIPLLFMIGATFWIGQSYAHSNTATSILGINALFLLLYGLSTTGLNTTETANITQLLTQHITTNPSNVMLLALIAYSAGVIIHAIIYNPHQTGIALFALATLLSLSMIYLITPTSKINTGLWIPFWTLFSLLWIRVYKTSKVRYVLYAC